MHSRYRFVILPAVGLGLLGAIVLLASCVPQPTMSDYYLRSEYHVTQPEIEIVGQTPDILVLGHNSSSMGSERHRGRDLWERLRSGMGLGIAHHWRIDRQVRQLASNASYLEQLSRRAQPYLHLILGEIERRGLPTELALLPEVESGYNPKAMSPKAASGMWQFIPDTGREFGLEQNAWYDGRNDIIASTAAALDYLQRLHLQFEGDWALALAGYNAGERLVATAQRKNRGVGKPTDFWALDLPSETAHYVPKLLAIAELVEHPAHHRMRLPAVENSPRLRVLEMGRQTDLARAAKLTGVRLADLRRLNSGLKRGKTLPAGPHRLLVPVTSARRIGTPAH
jgi:membrane-bound lytic murein transglycosylase D